MHKNKITYHLKYKGSYLKNIVQNKTYIYETQILTSLSRSKGPKQSIDPYTCVGICVRRRVGCSWCLRAGRRFNRTPLTSSSAGWEDVVGFLLYVKGWFLNGDANCFAYQETAVITFLMYNMGAFDQLQ